MVQFFTGAFRLRAACAKKLVGMVTVFMLSLQAWSAPAPLCQGGRVPSAGYSAKTNGYGLDYFNINDLSADYVATDCSNLTIFAQDVFAVAGYAQNTYRLYKDGIVIATKVNKPFIGFIPWAIDSVTFTRPPEAGTYKIERTGVGTVSTGDITVTYPPSLNCGFAVCFSTNTFPSDTWFAGTSQIDEPVVGDFDQDGAIDDIAYNGHCGNGASYWRMQIKNGASFSVQCWGHNSSWFGGTQSPHAPVVGDFDNDGFVDDIAYLGACGTGTSMWRIHMGQQTYFSVECWAENAWFAGATPTATPVVGDFDNDSFLDDIAYSGLCGAGVSVWRVQLGQVNHFDTECWGANSAWFEGSDPINMPVSGDFDEDGFVDDIAYFGLCGSGTECWRVHTSTGTDFQTQSFGADMWFGGTGPIHVPVSGDFDRDGYADDLAYYGLWGSGAGVPCWRVHLSDGVQFAVANYCDNAWFNSSDWTSRPLAGKFSNDAWTDIVYYGRVNQGSACWRAHILH